MSSQTPVVIMKKKGRPKVTLDSLKKQVNHLTATLEAMFMISFASASDHKHAGVVETTTQVCEDITQYTREDEDGVIRAPGFTIKQRGHVGDAYEHDKEGAPGRTYLNKMLKNEGEPRFEGPVTSPGNSPSLKDESTFKYVVNSSRSKYETHNIPIELVCEQTKHNTIHMKEVVDPALESARMEISNLKMDNLDLKRKFEAVTQVLESLVAHSERSDAIQNALIEHDELEFEESPPPVVMLMSVEELLQQGPPRIDDPAPVPLLAKLPIAKQIEFQGGLDKEEKEPSDKTRYWCFKPKSIQSMGTRHSRQNDEEEEEEEKEEVIAPSPKKAKVTEVEEEEELEEEEDITFSPKKTKVDEVIELNIEAPVVSSCDESVFGFFDLEDKSPFDFRNSFDFDFTDPLDTMLGV